MMTLTESQYRIREIQLKRRFECGEIQEWQYRYLLQGLRMIVGEWMQKNRV